MKKKFPWVQDYFTARVLLGFSEQEFWQSSPRKVYALKGFRDKAFGLVQPSKSAQTQVHEIQALLNLA